jgi:hypothetical protein
MVGGLYIPLWNKAKEPLAKWGRERLGGTDDGGNVNIVQYKPI